MIVAKLFTHVGSQGLQLQKEFRFESSEVHVRRVGDEVVLSARALASVQLLIDALDDFEPGLRLQRDQPEADVGEAVDPRL